MAAGVSMPSISYVVARSEPGHVIGCDNKLPWHLKTDLKHFKSVTSKHVVIMGRKTFESIGKPLPNRINIVMSGRAHASSPYQDPSPLLYFADSRDSALYFADVFSVLHESKDVFVIGGGAVYKEFKQIFNKVYLTEVYADVKGDAYFDYDFATKDWLLIEEKKFDLSDKDQFPFAIKTFKRKDLSPRKRTRLMSSFLKPDENLKAWEAGQLEKIGLPRSGANLLKIIQPKLPNIEEIAL
jgi:dihydrofolate reductase